MAKAMTKSVASKTKFVYKSAVALNLDMHRLPAPVRSYPVKRLTQLWKAQQHAWFNNVETKLSSQGFRLIIGEKPENLQRG